MSIQFDETLTKTFEYPSESSLNDDNNTSPTDDYEFGTDVNLSTSHNGSFMGSTPIGKTYM